MNQSKYAHDLLAKHNMLTSKPAQTPCAPNLKLTPTDGIPLADPHPYRGLVGSSHYLTFTRPDLSFAVYQVWQFMQSPTDIHLVAAKRILQYVNGTSHFGVFLQPGPFTFSAFSDFD